MTTPAPTGPAQLRARALAEFPPRLKAQIPRLNWTADQLATYQTERLRALLAHAIERSPFHARRLSHIDPARFELTDLSGLPTMTKAEMMSSFDDAVTDQRLTRRLVEEHMHSSGRESALLLDEYVCLLTGGSSAVRGVFVQTLGEYVDHAVSNLRKGIAGQLTTDRGRGRSAGGAVTRAARILRKAVTGRPAVRYVPPQAGTVVVSVTADAPVHSTRFLVSLLDSGPARMESVPVTLPIPEIVKRLNTLQPTVLTGYPTMIAHLAAEQRAGRLAIAPQAVVTTSEMLTDTNRAAITEAFGVPVGSQFGCTEGLTGSCDLDGPVFTFATDMCVVELVDQDGQPVPDGTPSAKVLITNLYNFTQPLIRYELQDSFTACPDEKPGGFLRATVDGLYYDLFHFDDGVSVHQHVVESVLDAAVAVTEYQVRQARNGIDVDVAADRERELDQAALTAALADCLRRAGLPDPQVSVRIVAAIERHPDTGKARRFISSDDPTGVST